jgi:hypothetical protein
MLRNIIILGLLSSCGFKSWKNNFLESKISHITNDTILSDLQKKYEILLISNLEISGSRNFNLKYYILAVDKKSAYKIYYEKKNIISIGEDSIILTTKPYNKQRADSIVSIFTKNSFWNIADIDEGCTEVDYKKKDKNGNLLICETSSHPYIRKLLMTTKNKMVSKTYISPEFWEQSECCSSSLNRIIFIKCENALNQIKI